MALFDGRPNGELLLATGSLEDSNPADCLTVRYELVKADRLFSAKKMILESLGFNIEEVWDNPVTFLGNPFFKMSGTYSNT